MNDIYYVFQILKRLLSTRLSFPPYSFTVLQLYLAFMGIGIFAFFIRKLFSSDD